MNPQSTLESPEMSQINQELLDQLVPQEVSEEQRTQIHERFAGVVDVVTSWAAERERDVESVTPLGGGFKNPVLLVTTSSGEQFVAKGFTEEEALDTTKSAQVRLGEIIKDDEPKLLPGSEIYSDTLFSEKAKGAPIKELLKEATESPQSMERAKEAFRAVGATLGIIHERTERAVDSVDDLSEESVAEVLTDRDKIMKHLDALGVVELTGMETAEIDAIKDRVSQLTEPEFVSLVHGDAHLDQFFHEEGGATVEIVDYDDIREGDPMADLGRLISSQRKWSEEFGVPRETEIEITKAIVEGYEVTRRESGLSSEFEELDPMRVVVYELRLNLIKLKNFTELREKITTIGEQISMTESEILNSDSEQSRVVGSYLSEEEQKQLTELVSTKNELQSILTYLRPVEQSKD